MELINQLNRGQRRRRAFMEKQTTFRKDKWALRNYLRDMIVL